MVLDVMFDAFLQEQELERRALIAQRRRLAALGARPGPLGRLRRALRGGLAFARRWGRPIPATPPRHELGTAGIEAPI